MKGFSRQPGSARIQMRLMLLGLTQDDPVFRAWSEWLTRAGVPSDQLAVKDLQKPTEFVDAAGDARYQALILSQTGLLEMVLGTPERDALEQLERELGLRRLVAYAYPGPEHGLQTPHWSGPLDGLEPTLTAAGRRVFPYLKASVPADAGSWVYLAAPDPGRRFETLVAGPEQSALVGVHRHDDGREEMVQLFDANSTQAHGQLLRRGQLAWLTRGTYLGYERHHLSVEVDDVLLPNYSWSVPGHRSDERPGSRIRMTAADGERAARWATSRGLRLDLAFNGAGSEAAAKSREADGLLTALLRHRQAFGWINHTYEHLDLDECTQEQIEGDIAANVRWAERVGITPEPHSVVTGAHTGLANLAAQPPRAQNTHLRDALVAQRIRYVACDASRSYPGRAAEPLAPGTPFMIGMTLAVPRHPTVLPHDAATRSQVLDRLRSEGRPRVDTFDQVIELEARRVFNAVISNDPRPHYFHQSNLIGGVQEGGSGLLYSLLDAVLHRYRASFADDVTLLHPTFGEIGRLLLRLQAWRSVLARESIRAYLDQGTVMIVNSSPSSLEVPLTGVAGPGMTGPGMTGGSGPWLRVAAGETVLERDPTVHRAFA